METESEKQVSLVLAGQPELADRLEEPRFEALKQRVALRCELAPFNLAETAAYIGGRLRIAGGNPGKIFTQDAVVGIHEASRGIARTISIICDNALLGGFGGDVRPVGLDIVAEVCGDFRLAARPHKPGAPPPGTAAMQDAPRPGVTATRGAPRPGVTVTPGAPRPGVTTTPGAPFADPWQEPSPTVRPEPPVPDPAHPPAARPARGGFFSRLLPRRSPMITLRHEGE
jgi:hypothetical protein